MKKEQGITLIALVITVIIMLILAGVSISVIMGGDGLFSKTNDAKVINFSEQMKEAISIYKLNKELEKVDVEIEKYPIVKNDSNQYITLDGELSLQDKDNLPNELKDILLSLSIDPLNTNVPSYDMIDYTKFYKLNTNTFNVPDEWKDNLYLWLDKDTNEYKLLNINGVEYNNGIIYVLIPFNDEDKSQYILIGNNTYKLYANGNLKVLGELNNNSGITEEEASYINDWNKLDLLDINLKFGNIMKLDNNGNAKKVYISSGTIFVIDQNNDLYAWGNNNSYNKLGLNHAYILSKPTKIFSNVKNVWAGIMNTYLITNDNKIFGAGCNEHGALGQGNTNTYKSFVEIKIDGITGADIEEIYPSLTSYNNTIIKCNANVGNIAFGAGHNLGGELGLGNTTNYSTFTKLNDNFNNVSSDKIAFNGMTTFLLKDNGDLYGCGINSYGQLGINDLKNKTSFVYITSNILDIKNNAVYYTVVKNNFGELLSFGGVISENDENVKKISNFERDENCKLLGNNIIISKGKAYSIDYTQSSANLLFDKYEIVDYLYYPGNFAVMTTNGIYTDLENITRPGYKANTSLRTVMENVAYISGRNTSIKVVDKNGVLYEDGFVKNTDLSNLKKVLMSGDSAVYALTNDGHLYAKGPGTTGLWGDVLSRDEFQHITSNGIDYIDNIKDIFVTPNTSGMCYITEEGKLYWSGSRWIVNLPNTIGDLNYGGTQNAVTRYAKEVVSPVVNSISKDIIDIQRSRDIKSTNTFILTNKGKIYVASNNANTSGLGKTVTSDFEELVIKENIKVQQIVSSESLTLALLENGEVYAWGYNTYGIMGNGYELNGVYSKPQKLAINNINLISLGNGFALFRTKTGDIYGIGKNEYGQLGTGDTENKIEFVRCPVLEE